MKKVFLCLAVALSVSLVAPMSHGALFISKALGTNFYYDFPDSNAEGWICLMLLPLCLLDTELGDSSLSKEHLLLNGFSNEEVVGILNDQSKLATILKEKMLKLEIRSYETREDIETQIKDIFPEVSGLYLEFLNQ